MMKKEELESRIRENVKKIRNIDQKIMEETDMIKAVMKHFVTDIDFDFYHEYRELGGHLPKSIFMRIFKKFFKLAFALYSGHNYIWDIPLQNRTNIYNVWQEFIEDDIFNPPSYEKIKMSVEEFWQIIDNVKDSENPYRDIKIHLDKLPIGKLISYQEHFDIFHSKAYRWDIWIAVSIGNNGCSDDGFTDFRNWLISRGKNVYEAVLENPDNLVELDLKYCTYHECFGSSAQKLYRKKTDEEMPSDEFGEFLGSGNPSGEKQDFDGVNERKKWFPRLWKKYSNFNWPLIDCDEVNRIFHNHQ